MSSAISAPPMSVATAYHEGATRMVAWTTKLNLAMALRDSWEFLDHAAYPEGSAARAAKAFELVTQTVCSPIFATPSRSNLAPSAAYKRGLLVFLGATSQRFPLLAMKR